MPHLYFLFGDMRMIDIRVRKNFSVATDIISHLAMLNDEEDNRESNGVSMTQDTVAFGDGVCVALKIGSKVHKFEIGVVITADGGSTMLLVGNWDIINQLACMSEMEGTALDPNKASPFMFLNDRRIHIYQFMDQILDEVGVDDACPAGDWIWRIANEFAATEIPTMYRADA
jgi:hypothetical protein